jgi:aminoglycoside 3-N-acetyltransferase
LKQGLPEEVFLTKMVTPTECVQALREIGLERGDTVMVHSSLRNIGQFDGIPKEDRVGFLQSILDVFDEVLDLEHAGALVVPTYFYRYGHTQEPFVYETSPADPSLGIFAEFVRTRPGALRSIHPLTSVTAIGYGKERICANVSKSCYGWNSPFDRLCRMGAKIVLLGVGFSGMTLIHHVGAMTGVTHFYHKAFFTPAFKDGRSLQLPFLSFVRNLNGKVFVHHNRLEKHMIENGLVCFGRFGGAKTMCVNARDVFTEAHKCLQQDPCFLIKDPYFVVE